MGDALARREIGKRELVPEGEPLSLQRHLGCGGTLSGKIDANLLGNGFLPDIVRRFHRHQVNGGHVVVGDAEAEK